MNCATGEIAGYQYWDTDFRTEYFVTNYINWRYIVFMYIVPFTLLLYFNTAIFRQVMHIILNINYTCIPGTKSNTIYFTMQYFLKIFFEISIQIRAHRHFRMSLAPNMVNQNGTTEDFQLAGMLFGIVITFILCNTLSVVTAVTANIFGTYHWMKDLIPISIFLVGLTFSTNFIYFCLFGTEFRMRLKTSFRSALPRKYSRKGRKVITVQNFEFGKLRRLLLFLRSLYVNNNIYN